MINRFCPCHIWASASSFDSKSSKLTLLPASFNAGYATISIPPIIRDWVSGKSPNDQVVIPSCFGISFTTCAKESLTSSLSLWRMSSRLRLSISTRRLRSVTLNINERCLGKAVTSKSSFLTIVPASLVILAHTASQKYPLSGLNSAAILRPNPEPALTAYEYF